MPYDDWTPLQFDNAVYYFGNWVEGKLHQFDKKTGKQLYTLHELIEPPPKRPATQDDWMNMLTGLGAVPRTG